ncbi:MAG: hypothetical protein HUJ75_02290 [Parasporobacterium sp.]|nr:hypothetical protein [Parasporobacterium sp.]
MRSTVEVVLAALLLVAACIGCGAQVKHTTDDVALVVEEDEIQPEAAAIVTVGRSEREAVEEFNEEKILLDFVDGNVLAELDYDNLDEMNYACMTYEEFDGVYGKYPMWNGAEFLTLDEITKMIKNTADLDTKYVEMHYSIQTAQSGNKFLIVKYDHMGLDYSNSDESCAFFVFSVNKEDWEKTGAINWTYACDSSPRHYVEFYKDGIIRGNGSNGAGDCDIWMSRVTADGRVESLYRERTLAWSWIADYIGDYEESEEYNGLAFSMLSTAGGIYYAIDANDDASEEKTDKIKEYASRENMIKVDSLFDKRYVILLNSGVDVKAIDTITDWVNVEIK